MRITRLPRKAFDAVEQPVASTAESLMETDRFMDALAATWKLQRSARRRVESGAATAMRLVGMPTGGDVVALVNQVGGLQRELRALQRELEAR